MKKQTFYRIISIAMIAAILGSAPVGSLSTLALNETDSAEQTAQSLPLENTSYILSEKISFGDSVKMYGSATGGVGDYQYAYYWKQAGTENWGGVGFSSETEKSFKPTKETIYNVCIKVKDGNNTVSAVYFDVEVKNDFANTSTISAESISLGEEVIMYGSATGGVSDYQYAYYWKQADTENWGGFGFSSEIQKSFKPTKETTYNICIKAKDSNGIVAIQYFDIEVKNNFVNTSTISSRNISLGEEVIMYGSATGNIGDCTYAYYWKQAGAEKWGGFGFSSEVQKSFKPTKETTYNVCIKVKDSTGTVAVEYFEVEVKNNFVNTSTISAENIALGEEVIMYGSVKGNIGDCTYAYYWKQAGAEKWGGFSFSSEVQRSFKPTKETTYNVCIKAKDSTGTVATQYFDVEVKNTLVNTSAVDTQKIEFGDKLAVKGSAKGGSGEYLYQYLYKKSSATGWSIFEDYTENETVNFIPESPATYDIMVRVKDSNGITADSEIFTVEVASNFKNTSTISAKNISLGEEVIMYGSATGNIGDCTYAYYWKQAGAEKWGGFGFSSEVQKSFKPTKETTYNICIKVKDSTGTVAVEYFEVEVKNNFVNTSTISAESISLGEEVIMYGSVKGNIGDCTYAYYWKQADVDKWGGFSFSSEVQRSFKPTKETTYNVCIKSKDSTGTVATQYFDVEVKNTLVNTSAVDTQKISFGDKLAVKGSAKGGSGEYLYQYLYKKSSATGWSIFEDYTENATVNFIPESPATYDIMVRVKDSNGITADSEIFTVEVENKFVNMSTVSAKSVSLGQEVIMYGSAIGNIGDCQYAYYFKQADATKWGGFGFSTEVQKSFKPIKETTYNICIKAKDSTGIIETKYFDVEVINSLMNTSTVEKTTVSCGEPIYMYGSARGGSGVYSYAFTYRHKDEDSFRLIRNYSYDSEEVFSIRDEGEYILRITVQDSNGAFADEKLFEVNVRNTLVNDSYVEADVISKGQELVMHGAAHGGSGEYTYKFFYKKPTDEKYSVKMALENDEKTAVIKPNTESIYNILIRVTDSYGKTVDKNIDVKVGTPVTSTSSVNSYNIKIGNALTIKCQGQGGSGEYQYKFLYGKVGESGDIALKDMTVISDFSTTNTASVKLEEFGEYKVVSIAKDSNGSQDLKYHIIKVNELSNLSKLNKTLIERGTSITIYGRSAGGKGTIKYAYQYKLVTDTNWKTIKGYSTSISCTFTPSQLGTYEIRVNAKDELGTVVPKVMSLTVKKPKAEEITDAVLPSILNDNMNDLEKVIAIHDWIVNNIEYDMEHYYDEIPPEWDSTAEGAYDHRKALCVGYAKLFRLLANTAGFEVKIVTGTATNASGSTEAHEWNHIEVNGEWYNVDVTWDDPVGSHMIYNYLLVPDSVINADHTYSKVSESCTAPQPVEYIETALAKTIANDTGKSVYLCKTDSDIKAAFSKATSKRSIILYKTNETSKEKIESKMKACRPNKTASEGPVCDYLKGYWTVNFYKI